MIIRSFSNTSGGLSLGLLILFSSFIGGYMVADFPKEFLDLFKTPLGQFFALLCINWLQYTDPSFNASPLEIFLESLICVIIIQSLKYYLVAIFPKKI